VAERAALAAELTRAQVALSGAADVQAEWVEERQRVRRVLRQLTEERDAGAAQLEAHARQQAAAEVAARLASDEKLATEAALRERTLQLELSLTKAQAHERELQELSARLSSAQAAEQAAVAATTQAERQQAGMVRLERPCLGPCLGPLAFG
jgi:chromosome segregation ATPase